LVISIGINMNNHIHKQLLKKCKNKEQEECMSLLIKITKEHFNPEVSKNKNKDVYQINKGLRIYKSILYFMSEFLYRLEYPNCDLIFRITKYMMDNLLNEWEYNLIDGIKLFVEQNPLLTDDEKIKIKLSLTP